MDFEGDERRQYPQEWMQLLASMKELRKDYIEIRRDIHCLHTSMKKYEPLLIRLSEDNSRRSELYKAVMEKSAVGVIFAIAGFLFIASWEWLKGHV